MRRTYATDVALAATSASAPKLVPYAEHLRRGGLAVWIVQLDPSSPNPLASLQENLERSRCLVFFVSPGAFGEEWPQLEAHLVRFREGNDDGRFLAFAQWQETTLPPAYQQYPIIELLGELSTQCELVALFARAPKRWIGGHGRTSGPDKSPFHLLGQAARRVVAAGTITCKALWLCFLSFFMDEAYCELAELMWSDGFGHVLIKGFLYVIVTISPNFDKEEPEAPKDGIAKSWMWFWAGCSISLLFCLVGCGIGSLLQGTFFPHDVRHHVSYTEDFYNLFLYAFVCPLYCGCCFAVIRLAADYWKFLSAEAEHSVRSPVAHSSKTWRRPVAVGLLAAFTIANTILYLQGILRLPMTKKWAGASIGGTSLQWPPMYYWFVSRTNHGEQALNGLGYYYALINAALLFVTVFGIMSYYSLSFEVIRIARIPNRQGVEPFALIKRLDAFRLSYLHARVLVFTYALNIFLWSFSPLGAGTQRNIVLATFMFWVLTGHLFSFPVNFIERRFSAIETDRMHATSPSSERKIVVDLLYPTHKKVDKIVSRLCGVVAISFGVYTSYSFASDLLKALVIKHG